MLHYSYITPVCRKKLKSNWGALGKHILWNFQFSLWPLPCEQPRLACWRIRDMSSPSPQLISSQRTAKECHCRRQFDSTLPLLREHFRAVEHPSVLQRAPVAQTAEFSASHTTALEGKTPLALCTACGLWGSLKASATTSSPRYLSIF